MAFVNYRVEADVALLEIVNPPVNALGIHVREGLVDGLRRAASEGEVTAIVIFGANHAFPAGADINEIVSGLSHKSPIIREVQARIEASDKPVVAAIEGTALGGGFELALACHWRVCAKSAKVGLPEVKLGLIPGAGGTQRFTRLAGPEAALEALTSGAQIPALRALEIGVVDELADDALAAAIDLARRVVRERRPLRLASAVGDRIERVDRALFANFRRKIEHKARGQLAPWKIIDSIEAACFRPKDEAFRLEREWFNDRLYLSMMVLGYGTPSSASSLARLFEDYIKAFFGAGIALGLFRRGRSAMDQQSRLPFITVHAGDGSNEIIDTEKLEQEILEAGYSLGTSDWLDANKDHPWVNLRVILDTISTVFHENKDCRKLFTACIWHYRSVLNKRPLDRLLESTISIEVLLGDRKASEGIGLTKLLSNRCAFLLGISSRSRERILELFEKIYTLRSAVVHEGRHKLGPGEIKIVNAAVELCGSIIRKEMHIRNEPGKDR